MRSHLLALGEKWESSLSRRSISSFSSDCGRTLVGTKALLDADGKFAVIVCVKDANRLATVCPSGGVNSRSYILLMKCPTPTATAIEARDKATLSGSVSEAILMLASRQVIA